MHPALGKHDADVLLEGPPVFPTVSAPWSPAAQGQALLWTHRKSRGPGKPRRVQKRTEDLAERQEQGQGRCRCTSSSLGAPRHLETAE